MGSLYSRRDWVDVTDTGMEMMDDFTTRDLFAALAMVGLIATPKQVFNKEGRKITNEADYAELAYEMADEMLKQKEKQDERVKDEN